MESRELEHFGRSLMYNKNSKGPRIEPWGTPQWIVFVTELVSTNWCLPFRYFLIQSFEIPRITAMIKFLKKDGMVKRIKRLV